MPVYRCFSPAGLLSKSTKTSVAEGITDIHTRTTGAPRLYVNVLFHEIPDGDCFVAGKPAAYSYIFGLIRHGRDLPKRQAMLGELSRTWAQATGQSEAEILVVLTEADPANAMQAGAILPEPGEEEQWLEANRAALVGGTST